MSNFKTVLASKEGQIYIERSGMATRCRLAAEALAQGRTVVLVARDREEYNSARALLTLFTPDLSLADKSVTEPQWNSPCLTLPPLSQRQDKGSWAARLAALYGLGQGQPRCVVCSVESLLLRHIPLNFFAARNLDLHKGSDYAPELLLEQAVEWGYTRVSMCRGPAKWPAVAIFWIFFLQAI